MGRSQLFEGRRLDVVRARHHDLRGRDGPQGRGSATALEQRTRPENRPGPDLGDRLTVHLDRQDAVEQEKTKKVLKPVGVNAWTWRESLTTISKAEWRSYYERLSRRF